MVLLGPPGTGKTHAVLSTWLLPALQSGVMSNEILSCSFTRAAAEELRARLAKQLAIFPEELRETCSTVHAEAYRRVRAFYGAGRFRVVNGTTVEARDDSEELERAERSFEPSERIVEIASNERDALAFKAWDFARNTLVRDVESNEFRRIAAAKAPGVPLTEVVNRIRAFENAKEKNGAIDFTDMLLRALEAEDNFPARAILVVDEAQDSTLLQWALVEKWAMAAEVVVLVGDFDQTIHEWAGARPEKLHELLEEGYEVRRLERSHRVPSAPHAVACSLIRRNVNRIDAPYEPAGRIGSVAHARSEDALELVEEFARRGREVFVLARSARILMRWAGELVERTVPFSNERGGSPLGAPAAIAVARAVAALASGFPCAREDARRLIASLPARPKGRFFTGHKKVAASAVQALPVEIGASELASIGVLVAELVELGFEQALAICGLEERASSIARLVEKWSMLVLDKAPPVTLTTMHAAKGREADLVVVDLAAPQPTVMSVLGGDPKAIESERRLLYVALTRTKDELVAVPDVGRDLGDLLGLEELEGLGSW